MNMYGWRRGGLVLMGAALVIGLTGCQSGDDTKKAAASGPARPAQGTAAPVSATDAIDAALKKVSGVRSATFSMKTSVPVPKGTAGAGGTTTTTSSGVMGWRPFAMEMTTKSSALTAADTGGLPTTLHAVLTGTTEYVDLGADAAKELDGVRWIRMDLADALKPAGQAVSQLADGAIQQANQGPTQQLGLLLRSPNIAQVGPATVDDVATEHYKGSFTLDQMLRSGPGADGLSAADLKQLAAGFKKVGLTSEDTDVWVDGDGYPVRVEVTSRLAAGVSHTSVDYSHYSAKPAAVHQPAAGQSITMAELTKKAQAEGAAG